MKEIIIETSKLLSDRKECAKELLNILAEYFDNETVLFFDAFSSQDKLTIKFSLENELADDVIRLHRMGFSDAAMGALGVFYFVINPFYKYYTEYAEGLLSYLQLQLKIRDKMVV